MRKKRDKKDGWRSTCEAFPEGIPVNYKRKDGQQECNNRVGYAPDPVKVKLFDI